MMSNEFEKEIVIMNKEISELLLKVENKIREQGYTPPINNFVVSGQNRIKIPNGYIRTVNEFCSKYHLSDLIYDENVRKNILYALQLSDYYNFILNRIYVWGPIEVMLYKQAFINNISIIEALILDCANHIRDYCINNSCGHSNKCKKRPNKQECDNMKYAARKLYEMNILSISEAELTNLIDFYEYRNKIHIRLSEENEYKDNKYNQVLSVNEKLLNNAVPLYGKCLGSASLT